MTITTVPITDAPTSDLPSPTRIALAPPRSRVRLPAAVRHGLTMTWRSLIQLRRSPEQFFDLTLQPIMFTVLFVFLFGGAVDGDWHSYLQYVMPGLLVQTVLFATLRTGIALNTDITKGVFDRFRTLPIARSAPLTGAVLGDVIRYVVSIIVMFAFGLSLGFHVQTGLLPVVAAAGLVLAFAFALCWVSALLGMVMKTPQTVQGVGALALFRSPSAATCSSRPARCRAGCRPG
jgi:oleandomycin transport system permease protein